MTIHHDKLAYGKLASAREDISDERLMEMLAEIETYENGDETDGREGEESACRKTKEKN